MVQRAAGATETDVAIKCRSKPGRLKGTREDGKLRVGEGF